MAGNTGFRKKKKKKEHDNTFSLLPSLSLPFPTHVCSKKKNAKVSPMIIAFQNQSVLLCILIVWSVDEDDEKFGLPGK